MYNILYISYDGVLEPLGQSQVLAYLKKLAKSQTIHLISFEKKEDWGNKDNRKKIKLEIASSGIVWHPLRYHKRLSVISTGWDIFCGTLVGTLLVLRYQIKIIHARSYVASVIALTLKKILGVKFIFDMRGFWVDERVDGEIWRKNGILFKIGKWFERKFLKNADHIISLTKAAIREIKNFDFLNNHNLSFTIIPTCTDLTHFKPISGYRNSKFILGYVGSVGTWYLFDEVLVCFKLLLSILPEAKLLIINRGEHNYIQNRIENSGISINSIELISSAFNDIPTQMARMDAGVFFIKKAYSKIASAPTKLGEFLACGVPCLSNAGIGDTDEILEGEKVGVSIENLNPESIFEGLKNLIILVDNNETSSRCVYVANKYFSLNEGVNLYLKVYQEVKGIN